MVLPPGTPPAPARCDPWNGTVCNVLISDRGVDQDGVIDNLWIGFNFSQNWQNFLTLGQQAHLGCIGGQVVVDAKNPLGFYLDPNSAVGAEVTGRRVADESRLHQEESGAVSEWAILVCIAGYREDSISERTSNELDGWTPRPQARDSVGFGPKRALHANKRRNIVFAFCSP